MVGSDKHDVPPRRFSDGVSLPELARYLREGVYIMDSSGVTVDANPVAMDLLGVRQLGEAPLTPVRDRSRSREVWRAEMDALARDGVVREFTREIERPDGTLRTVLDTCYARNDNGVITYHGIVIDVSVVAARDARDARDRGDAHTRDTATGAYTVDYLDLLDERMAASAAEPLAVCVVHVPTDNNASEAERWSLAASQLEHMTRFLLRHIRAYEVVVRTAHDQLVVVLPGADDRAAEIVGRRLQLAALRSAPTPFRLGWAARLPGEAIGATVSRALESAVPVPVVERHFEPARQR